MRFDMHIHSNISDGSESLEQIIQNSKRMGLDGIAITNHDTVYGLEEAIELGKEEDIKVIKGIEISAYDYKRNQKVHILGYNFNKTDCIELLCKSTRENRNKNSLKKLDTLINRGYEIDKKKIIARSKLGGVLYKQHIMHDLIDKGYADTIYGNVYKALFKVGDLSKDIRYVDVYEAIKAIQDDGGIAVLAHLGELTDINLLYELVKFGIDGIEVNHIKNRIKERVLIKDLARKHNLILTGGSDYHGVYGDSFLGQETCNEENIKLNEINWGI
ncbi:MAG: PHP domain-containing protein [Sarcina sp.]